MKANMGDGDRTIRLLTAGLIVILYLADSIKGTLATVLLILAGIFLVTSYLGVCPLYRLLGINTSKWKKNP
jgi:hypothetical protein